MRARWYTEADAQAWDALCESAYMSTLLHTRRYMAHHGDRFIDRSVLIEEDDGRFLGAIPAAVSSLDAAIVVSHPGLTYGGVLHTGDLRGSVMLQALLCAADLWQTDGHRALLYKAVPHIYQRAPAQDDLYALFRLGAQRSRCDLSACVALDHKMRPAQRRVRSLRKARSAGVHVVDGAGHVESLWAVLEDNLRRKHGKAPTHSAAEIAVLAALFPASIEIKVAMLGPALVAGAVLFHTPTVAHAQYIASSEEGQAISALDAVFEVCMADAVARGARWFDFGISTEQHGQVLNDGLHRFKTEFGAGAVVHEFYQWNFTEGR
jgi:hypothetical protein